MGLEIIMPLPNESSAEILGKLGITCGARAPWTKKLCIATLPDGWTTVATGSSSCSILDEKARVRVRVEFGIGNLADDGISLGTFRLLPRYTISNLMQIRGNNVIGCVCDGSTVIHTVTIPYEGKGLVESADANRKAVREVRQKLQEWLKEHGVSNHDDPFAYWDDPVATDK